MLQRDVVVGSSQIQKGLVFGAQSTALVRNNGLMYSRLMLAESCLIRTEASPGLRRPTRQKDPLKHSAQHLRQGNGSAFRNRALGRILRQESYG